VAGLAVAAGAIVFAHLARLPTEPGPATVLGLAVLVGTAVYRRPAGRAAAVGAAGLVVVVASRLLVLPSSSGVIPNLAALGWVVAVATGLALRLRDARRRATAAAVRREERLDLARELHDVVAHHITGIVLQAQAAQLLANHRPPHQGPADRELADRGLIDRERLVGVLAGIEGAGSEALAAMRRVVGVLRDGGPAPAGPVAPGIGEVGELVRRFEGQGVPVRLRVPAAGIDGWPPEVSGAVYRIVQEALTNVARHATRATAVSVVVQHAATGVSVEVSDDAPAAPARLGHRAGYGLVGMRERVETLGGTLTAGPRSGADWTVLATLPVAAGEAR
jgi:signal transduction histidine kinase